MDLSIPYRSMYHHDLSDQCPGLLTSLLRASKAESTLANKRCILQNLSFRKRWESWMTSQSPNWWRYNPRAFPRYAISHKLYEAEDRDAGWFEIGPDKWDTLGDRRTPTNAVIDYIIFCSQQSSVQSLKDDSWSLLQNQSVHMLCPRASELLDLRSPLLTTTRRS